MDLQTGCGTTAPPKKRIISVLALLLAGVLVSTAVAAGSTLYLRIRYAPVRSEASFSKGSSTGNVYLNQVCEVLERSKDNDWIRVRYSVPDGDGTKILEGWLNATVLNERPAKAERDEGCRWLREGAKALPGAGDASKKHAERRRQDLNDLLDLEKLYPSTDELDSFLKAGQLGLYRTDWPSQEGGVTE